MLCVKIAGVGSYLPEKRVTSAELELQLGLDAGWIERTTGVRERRYAGRETAVSMAVAAATMAIENAGLSVKEIDAIIGASAAPHQLIPCTAALVQRELGGDGGSACFDINATCISFLFALHTAAHLIAADVYRTVLIFSSEITTHGLNSQEPESAVLFGDAAAAAIVTRSQPGEVSQISHANFVTFSSGAHLSEIVGLGTLHHPNDPTTKPEMNLFHMDGPSVFRQSAHLFPPFFDRFLNRLNWKRETINAVVPHQASRHAIKFIGRRLQFRPEQIVVNLSLRGNCVAASLPLAFAEAVYEGRIRRGDKVLFVGAGAGLTLGGLALTF
jgi:3-oxoacyl-[acyl-carrier-protein] synthase-3